MNILVVTEQGTWFEPHIIGSLRKLGHEVETFFYGTAVGEFYGAARSQERGQRNSALLESARRLKAGQRLDLIFCYVYDDFLQTGTARALKGLGAPMVNYNVDMACQWYRQIKTAKYFTRMLCAQSANMPEFSRHGGRPMFFPMASIAPAEESSGSTGFQPDASITFAGAAMPYRAALLKNLIEAGLPVAVYGKFWREGTLATPGTGFEKAIRDIKDYALARLMAEGPWGLLETAVRKLGPSNPRAAVQLPPHVLHGFVPNGSLEELFAKSAINIGITRISGDDPNRPGRTQVKLRDFEVPAAGGFYLVEEAPDYELHFEPGVEVVTWKTPAELSAKIRYYLEHDGERCAIAAAGRRRALKDHTWPVRFASLFSELGLE